MSINVRTCKLQYRYCGETGAYRTVRRDVIIFHWTYNKIGWNVRRNIADSLENYNKHRIKIILFQAIVILLKPAECVVRVGSKKRNREKFLFYLLLTGENFKHTRAPVVFRVKFRKIWFYKTNDAIMMVIIILYKKNNGILTGNNNCKRLV